jgi:hypothetical protein
VSGSRMIHDKVCESQKLNSVSFEAAELWFRLLTVVDDNGNYYADPLRVYANLMSEKELATMESTDAALKALQKSGLVLIYKADKRSYLHITDFEKHQSLRKDLAADVSHPLHPSDAGPAYTENGKRRDMCVRPRTELEQSVTEPNRTEQESRFKGEVEVKGEGKDQVESVRDDEFFPKEPNYGSFVECWKEVNGITPISIPQLREAYRRVCRKYNETDVLDAINEWSRGKSKKQRKHEFGPKNFLERECGDILDARMAGKSDSDDDHLPLIVNDR